MRSAPHTAPVITKIHFPFDVPTSPRSVRTTEKTEPLFVFEKNGDYGRSAGVIIDSNNVYYNHRPVHSNDNKISGDSNNKCRSNVNQNNDYGVTMEKRNTDGPIKENLMRMKHFTDDNYGGGDELNSNGYSKYSRKEMAARSAYGANATASSSKVSKQYPHDYGYAHTKKAQRFDHTLFPFDREAVSSQDDWCKDFGNKYYDTPSPDGDYYKHFGGTRDGHEMMMTDANKRMDALDAFDSGKKQQSEHMNQPQKMSKYDTPAPTFTNISKSDAFTPNPTQHKSNTNECSKATRNEMSRAFEASPFAQNGNELLDFGDKSVSKFEQIPPKSLDAFRIYQDTSSSLKKQQQTTPPTSQTHSNMDTAVYGAATSPLPDLRVDFFTEAVESANARKRSSCVEYTMKQPAQQLIQLNDNSPSGFNTGTGINVTPNPMDESTAGCTQTPRATIVVQQVQ